MSARTRSVSAAIRVVSAPPALRIDVVGLDPPTVLLPRPAAGWAWSSAGQLFSISESSEQLPSIAPRWPHPESQEPGCATTWPAVRRRIALRSSIAGVACSTDGCLPSGGRARSESVSASCAMVGWALSIGLIDLPFSHWTHVTFKQFVLRPVCRSVTMAGVLVRDGNAAQRHTSAALARAGGGMAAGRVVCRRNQG
jgi:hypothetical protein